MSQSEPYSELEIERTSIRLKKQHTDRLFGRGHLCFYREKWMDSNRSAHTQLLEKAASSTLVLVRKSVGGTENTELYPKRFPPKDFAHRVKKLARVAKYRLSRERQKEEWLGDALLRFFCREWLLQQHPNRELHEICRFESRLQSNKFLDSFAKANGFPDCNSVEVQLHAEYSKSPKAGKAFALRIFEHQDC